MNIRKLTFRNLLKKPVRTVSLVILTAFMAFTVLSGSVIIQSLRGGLGSVEKRLGADIIAVPASAEAETDIQNILLQGTPGYFYMDKTVTEKIAAEEGVEKLSVQYFLASSQADCCSAPVQIIGYDSKTDFVIEPWIKENYNEELKDKELIAGSNLGVQPGEILTLYGVDCTVASKLAPTGTGLDTAVYTNENTVKCLIAASKEKGFTLTSEQDPDDVISSVYIKVKEGYDISEVSSNINIDMKGTVKAVRTKNMISDTADKLSSISDMVMWLIIAIWVLTVIIMIIAFTVNIHDRKREFAVLRLIGFSRKKLFKTVFTESIMICLTGGLIGTVMSFAAVLSFSKFIEISLDLPFLIPDLINITILTSVTIIAIIIAGPLSSAYSAFKLCRVDTGSILRK